MLSFTTFSLPFISVAISSSAGAIMRHGPHHSAQKSTTTGLVDFSTSASKFASDTLPTAMGHLVISNREKRTPERQERMDAPVERQGGSRGGEGCESRIQRFCRNFAQGRDIRPHQSGADGPAWI